MDSHPNRTKKFRPQTYLVSFHSRTLVPRGRYNWIPRLKWSAKNYLHHVFSVLHYKSSHAPGPIQQKWRIAARKFEHRHRKIL